MFRDPKIEIVDLTSTIKTHGLSGKWPGKKFVIDLVTLLMATIQYPGLYSTTLSASRNLKTFIPKSTR
jgi:hypothetical protein